MYWPDTKTGTDVEPTRKPVASAVRKYFSEGGLGQPPTVPGGDWFNQITNEMLNVLSAAGIDPSKTDDDQLLQAIQRVSISSDEGSVAEVAAGEFPIGARVSVIDRSFGVFEVVAGGVSNGIDILSAGGGNTAVLSKDQKIYAEHLGVIARARS